MLEVEEKTEFTFDELDERAKERARDKWREGAYDYDWWDCTFEDAAHMGAMLGIEIAMRPFKTMSGSTRQFLNIYFEMFRQGSGATFDGNYSYAPDAVEKIKAETNDKELLRIASELTALQVACMLQHSCMLRATISTSHGGNLQVEARLDDDDLDWVTGTEDTLTELMNDFANWIYNNLEAEYEYLNSDEVVDEYLKDGLLFDEYGETI